MKIIETKDHETIARLNEDVQKIIQNYMWRLLLATLVFMPVYLIFGYLVHPFIGNYICYILYYILFRTYW